MAKYGLIGNPLGHSISPKIHALLGICDYSLFPIKEEELSEFVKRTEPVAFNVTIPYKQKIIPFLTEVKGAAKEIGAVNTVVKTENGTVGYNTDANGMEYALAQAGISLNGKNVLILGTGGTSRTAAYVAEKLGAKSIIKAGRNSEINYDNVYDRKETEVIINTTPVGMFPDADKVPLSVEKFPRLTGVFDCIYNPSETLLVKRAKENGVNAANGILMLIEQARKAEELFLGKPLPETLSRDVAEKLASSFNR